MAGGLLHPLVLSPLVLPQSLLSLLPAVKDGLECVGRTVAWALLEVIGPQPIPPVEMQTLFLPYTENGVYPLLCSVQGESSLGTNYAVSLATVHVYHATHVHCYTVMCSLLHCSGATL